ncbi:MAG: hypothetical protein WCX73_03135 [Candidatus Pacearchaeota archaeon]|jgi:hypothetical protein
MINTKSQKYTSAKMINLDFIIKSYAPSFQVKNTEKLVIIPDTCSIKRIPLSEDKTPLFTSNTPYDIKITKRIFNEMQRQVGTILPHQTFNLFYLISSDIIHPEVSNENLKFIQNAKHSSGVKGKMGIADMQPISYAIDRARQGEQTIIMSDDNHILKTVSHLRKKSIEREVLHPNIFAFGIRCIVERFPEYQSNNGLN